MNVVIEVVTAEGIAVMVESSVAILIVATTSPLTSAVTTLIAFVLRQGATSQNAVSPVYTLQGGLAVA